MPTSLAPPQRVCDIPAVDAAVRYRQLVQLGREEFIATAAAGAFVRNRTGWEDGGNVSFATQTVDHALEGTMPNQALDNDDFELEVIPLLKKPGAAYPDRITIGRTSNNDVVLPDSSVSRLHAYVRREGDTWVVADAGSKNGSWLHGAALAARREQPLISGTTLRLGEVEVTFYTATDLFAALGGA